MNRKKSVASCMAICLFVTAFAISLHPIIAQAYTEKPGYVTSDKVNVRPGPGTERDNKAFTQLSTGHEVTVIGEADDSKGRLWYRIRFYQDGKYQEGYMSSDYVRIVLPDVGPDEDPDYESYLEEQQFPESYRVKLRALHKIHPTWIFVAMPLSLQWSDVVAAESKLGVNLVPASSKTSWKSLQNKAIDWSTGEWIGLDTDSWVAASEGIIRYYLDPRNFLSEDSKILQFETLRYIEGEQTIQGIANVLKDTFMATDEYYRIFMEAGKENGVNPYHLASRCRQEVGSQGSNSTKEIKESQYAEFNGYYNYFNIGASPSKQHNSMYNGLARAKSEGWDTPEKSIKGGAAILAEKYINKQQDTLYLQKFDVVDGGDGVYRHQYMTNLQAAASEASLMKKAYGTLDGTTVTYSVPVYQNMPQVPAAQPTDDGSPYSVLASLSVNGFTLNQAFDGYQFDYTITATTKVESVDIQASAYAPGATISGTGNVALTQGTNILTVICNNWDNKLQKDTSRTYRIRIIEPVMGDADLDGEITVADALKALRFAAELETPDEQHKKFGDVNKNGSLDADDALRILKYVAGQITSLE